MLCCTLGTLIAAATAKRLMPGAGLLVAACTVAVVASALAAYHLGHYLDRARANERTLLAEIMAQPICAQSGLALIIPNEPLKPRRKS